MKKENIISALQNAKVPAGSVNSLDQALNHPQTLSRKMVKLGGDDPFVRTPIIFGDYDLHEKKASPELGAGTEAIRKKILVNKMWEKKLEI